MNKNLLVIYKRILKYGYSANLNQISLNDVYIFELSKNIPMSFYLDKYVDTVIVSLIPTNIYTGAFENE